MPDVDSWWDIAKNVGAGGAFVLGVVSMYLWRAYREELTYSKTRDRETLTVLAAMTSVGDKREDRILAAILDLKSTVLTHYPTKK